VNAPTLDRAGARRSDARWLAGIRADPSARALAVTADRVCLHDGRLAQLPLAELDGEPLLLGLVGATPLFAVDVTGHPRTGMAGLREAAAMLSRGEAGLAAYASALAGWHRRHPFCAACGSATAVREGGHVRVCPRCGAVHHPRTDPVVITLVADGDRALLGRQPAWPGGRYSALAGFVEPGETLEEAVAREVREEACVEVAEPRYRASQPWPFPSSLMLAFTARYAGGEARVGDAELEDVRWFSRDELRAAAAGSGPFALPPPIAIARLLIGEWIARP
jgi:NAD+ diphosphatase